MATKISENELMMLTNEIKISEKLMEELITPQMNAAITRYLGYFFPDGFLSSWSWEIYLNEIYPIIQHEMPSIFFRNPRAFLKPRHKHYIAKRRDPVSGKKVDVQIDSEKSARTQEHILNYTIDLIKYKVEARRWLMNALIFKYGVLWHGYKGDFGMTDEQSLYIDNEQVFVKNLSPRDFLFDPKVALSNIDEARWVARKLTVPIDDLVDDPEIKLDKSVKGKPGFGDPMDNLRPSKFGADTRIPSRHKETLLDSTSEEFKKQARFVTVYEVFMRPSKKQKLKGDKGTVLLLTDEQIKPLRDPKDWPYKTNSWPAKILQFNEVPETMFGMSDLEVYGPIADHKNMIFNLQVRNAEANSKIMIGYDRAGLDEETIMKIEEGEQNIIGFDGDPRTKMSMASPGTMASSELYMLDQRIQFNLDEKSGISELKKGFLRSGEESATSVRIRNAGSSARPAYRQDIMADNLRDSFKFINDLNQQFMPVKEAVRIVGTLDIAWSDNPTKEEIQADVDVEIDPISMLPEDPQKEIEEMNLILNLMTQALNDPGISRKLLEEGKMFNLSPVIETLLMRLKVRNPEIFRSIRQEESMGFASIAELRAAQANIEAIASGQQPPSPPEEGQDHRTRLGVYDAALRLQQLEGKVNEALVQLALIQKSIAEQEEDVKNPRIGKPVNFRKPTVKTFG